MKRTGPNNFEAKTIYRCHIDLPQSREPGEESTMAVLSFRLSEWGKRSGEAQVVAYTWDEADNPKLPNKKFWGAMDLRTLRALDTSVRALIDFMEKREREQMQTIAEELNEKEEDYPDMVPAILFEEE